MVLWFYKKIMANEGVLPVSHVGRKFCHYFILCWVVPKYNIRYYNHGPYILRIFDITVYKSHKMAFFGIQDQEKKKHEKKAIIKSML